MARYALTVLASASSVAAFPWVASLPGVDSSLFGRELLPRQQDYAPGTCPNNPVHTGAAPYTAPYLYTGAQNGLPGTQIGGQLVPAKGDKAHQYTPPGKNDIRGPCPGLNAAANHNFLSHDGITTFQELVDAQQNVYNVGYDLAVLLAALGVNLDGDIPTQRLSIGCDATSRTASIGGGALGQQPGLNGHNRFEGDTSLTRNDYFLADGDDYTFNSTLFEKMRVTCNSVFDRKGLSLYRYQRYQESRRDNANFYYGPKALLLYGAASFLYELFPSFGNLGTPDLATIATFFGAKSQGNGKWSKVPERIPDNWFSRVAPYTIPDVAREIGAQYNAYPVEFGANSGINQFTGFGTNGFSLPTNATFDDPATQKAIICALYQLITDNVPASISRPEDVLEGILTTVNPIFKNYGCPIKLNN